MRHSLFGKMPNDTLCSSCADDELQYHNKVSDALTRYQMTFHLEFVSLDKLFPIEWEEPVSDAQLKWDQYLNDLTGDNKQNATLLWNAICEFVLKRCKFQPQIPQASPIYDNTDNEVFQFVWDRNEHHLEASITNNKMINWFYRNSIKYDYNAGFGYIALMPDHDWLFWHHMKQVMDIKDE